MFQKTWIISRWYLLWSYVFIQVVYVLSQSKLGESFEIEICLWHKKNSCWINMLWKMHNYFGKKYNIHLRCVTRSIRLMMAVLENLWMENQFFIQLARVRFFFVNMKIVFILTWVSWRNKKFLNQSCWEVVISTSSIKFPLKVLPLE